MNGSDNLHALIGVIADDLTGANATGVLLRKRGFRTAALTGMEWPSGGLAGYDCVVINTESRAAHPRVAYDRVLRSARLILANDGMPLGKRIDSTLRGNLGPEIEAVLAALGRTSMAVLTGAFPASGRTTRDGVHYVNGVPLAETPVRDDPLMPVTESHVPTLVAAQTDLSIAILGLGEIRQGPAAVADRIREESAAGVRILCADAETDADVENLAQGMAQSGLRLVAADPGPLTASYARALMATRRRRAMVVAGSVSEPSRAQLDRLEREMGAHLVVVDAAALAAGGDEAEQEVDRVLNELLGLDEEIRVIGVRSGKLLERPDPEDAEQIADGFAEIAARALKAMPDIAGLYTTGGDITLAVCRRLGSRALNLVEEVLPLAVSARLMGGQQPGLPIVTKGGLVGGPDAAVQCVSKILEEVEHYD